MNDFKDNFGNFSACFAVETQMDAAQASHGVNTDRFGNPLEETKDGNQASEMWSGAISVSREDPIALSAFHQELNQYAGFQEDERPGAESGDAQDYYDEEEEERKETPKPTMSEMMR